jgi:hypothetical protein
MIVFLAWFASSIPFMKVLCRVLQQPRSFRKRDKLDFLFAVVLPLIPTFCFLYLPPAVFFTLLAWFTPQLPSHPSLAHTYYLATSWKVKQGPFKILYFYDDSTFVALRSSGLLHQGDSLVLHPELGYTLFRGRMRASASGYCCSYSVISGTMRPVGQALPHQESALRCQIRRAATLRLAGVTFQAVPANKLPYFARQSLSNRAQRQDQTHYQFDCK